MLVAFRRSASIYRQFSVCGLARRMAGLMPLTGAPGANHIIKWTFVRQPPRKLTVLASIDVAGFTRLIQDDERGTLSQLAALRNDMLNPLLTAYGGDMFKTMGDGGLI
jgi:class 3 adenylate cyclase